jgi:hypothetical protein
MSPQPSSPPERQTAKKHHRFACNECLVSIVEVFVKALHQSVNLALGFSKRIITTHFNLKNRPSINPSRGRSIRQGGRMGDTYRRYKTCH